MPISVGSARATPGDDTRLHGVSAGRSAASAVAGAILPKRSLPPPANAIRLALGPYPLSPGRETTVCVTGYLPNVQPLDVVRIETRQSYSHHIILYRESEGIPDAPVPVSCPPLDILSTSRAPLFIGETPTAAMDLPPGVAYRLGSGAPYRIEGHFLNASPNPQQALAEIFLTPAPAARRCRKPTWSSSRRPASSTRATTAAAKRPAAHA